MEEIKNKILNQLSIDDVVRDGRTCLARPNFWTQAGTGRKKNIFPVQLTTSRVGNLIRLVHTLLFVQTIHIQTNKNPLTVSAGFTDIFADSWAMYWHIGNTPTITIRYIFSSFSGFVLQVGTYHKQINKITFFFCGGGGAFM